MQLQDRFYKSTEVAEILGVSLRTLYRYMENAKINSVHLPSGRHRFTKQQIEDFLYSNAFEPEREREVIRPIKNSTPYSSFQRPTKPLEVNNNYVTNSSKFSPNLKNEPSIPTDEELDKQLDDLLKSLNTDDTLNNTNNSNNVSNIEFAPNPNISSNPSASMPQYAAPTPAPVINNDNYLDTDDDELDKLLKSLEEDDNEQPQTVKPNYDVSPKSYTSVSDDSFDGFRIKPQEEIIDENKVIYFYCPSNDLRTIAKIIKKAGDENGLKYAFTLNAGASLYFPLDPFSIIHFYVHKNDLDIWKKELQLKDSTPDDANIGILITKGGAFENISEVSGLKVVSKAVLINNLRSQNLNQLARQVEDQL